MTSAPYVRGHARIRIGDHCTFSSLNVRTGRFRDTPTLEFGDHCYVAFGVMFQLNERITIGNHVLIAGNSDIQDSDGHPWIPNDGCAARQSCSTAKSRQSRSRTTPG